MHLNTLWASYTPSFYYINIESFDDFGNLKSLYEQLFSDQIDEVERSRLANILGAHFHEYFHFVQDTTSVYGLTSAWNVYSQLIGLLAYYQDYSKTDSDSIRIDNALALKELSDFRLYITVFGDMVLNAASNYAFENLRLYKCEVGRSKRLEGSDYETLDCFVTLHLDDPDGNIFTYQFGGGAIVESMTSIFQGKFFDISHQSYFPYRSALLVAELLVKSRPISEDEIFVLCDLSLMTPYPGFSFVDLLNLIEIGELCYSDLNELFDNGLVLIKQKWDVENLLIESHYNVINILEKLSNHEHLSPTIEWIKCMLSEAVRYRQCNPRFMVDLIQTKSPISNELTDFFLKIGGPELRNLDRIRWFKGPDSLTDDDDVFPGFLQVLSSVWKLFTHGFSHRSCSLESYCRKSNTQMPVDAKCLNAPWEKANEDPLCPYGSYWRLWALKPAISM